jgi:glycosyltransferase involved in cell wall biosynthesis
MADNHVNQESNSIKMKIKPQVLSKIVNQKPTVIVGISAYNEETNIGYLLKDLLRQKQTTFTLSKIIVASDGSTDNTENIVKKIRSSKIRLINDGKRLGLGKRQNQIFEISDTDILVLIQADVILDTPKFIAKLIEPIIKKKVHITAATLRELPPQTFFESVLFHSMKMKRRIFDNFKKGNNLYTCHGPARAFSKKLYKKLLFKGGIGEDGYSYLYCIFNNYKYQYAKKAKVYYRLPDNLSDHIRQSLRYETSKKIFADEFKSDYVKKEYLLPISLILKELTLSFINQPILVMSYLIVLFYIRFKLITSPQIKQKWDVSLSSKKLRPLFS